MAAQPSSGSTSFRPSFGDLLLDVFGRVMIRSAMITGEHMWQARMSASLMLSEWSVKPTTPNLWKMELISIPLAQGVPTYSVPQNVVGILDYYIRQFELSNTTNLSQCFATVAASTLVTVTWPANSVTAGAWIQVVVPFSIGGILLYGLYQVQTVLTPNTFTITAAAAAASSASTGQVPIFTTVPGSTSVAVSLPNHGQVVGAVFNVDVATAVGGLSLSGPFTVVTVPDANNFTIAATANATFADTQSENTGYAQLAAQPSGQAPEDRVVTPISRTEYAAQPNKFQQAFPTTVWWDRAPAYGGSSLTTWPVADQNGPYLLFYWAMVQIDDVQMQGGASLDVPERFLEAFASGLAAKLAWKYPENIMKNGISPEKLDQIAERAWAWASGQDTENVPIFISPGLGGYLRN